VDPHPIGEQWSAGRGGNAVKYVLIHDTEGGWDASVATLQNDPGKSAHYIVGTDGRLGQFVHEKDTAWHCGNFFYNQRSVGIEHVGYSTKAFPTKLYETSARLLAHLTTKYQVPKDRAHVIGHDQVPNGNRIAESAAPCSASPKECQSNTSYGGASHHTDPGVWEWCTFMARFGGTCKCNDAWELWNCSSDRTQAFRCAGGKIEIASCGGGCEVKPQGEPDDCVDPRTGSTVDIPPTHGTMPGKGPSPELFEEPAPGREGCNFSGGANGSAAWTLFVAALFAIRRRNSH
jgi:MYXO-CTERM domain-containing protein